MEPSDSDLLVATTHDPDAFARFYRRHAAGVLGYFRRRVRGADVAFDLTAETFAAALEAAPRFVPRRDPDSGAAWLYTIARHKLSEATRRGTVEDRTRRRLAMEPVVLDDEGIARLEQEADDALRALDALPADQATALRARLIEERDYEEIAAELECSPSVVRKRVSRGLSALRATWKETADGS